MWNLCPVLPDEVDLAPGVHHVELHTAARGAGEDEDHGVGHPPVFMGEREGVNLQQWHGIRNPYFVILPKNV